MTGTAEIIEKLEGAEVGSRELDLAIALSLDQDFKPERFMPTGRYRENVRLAPEALPYSTSLDAALALAERVLPPETFWTVSHHAIIEGGKLFHAEVFPRVDTVGQPDFYGRASTPALALCIAILRARQSNGDQ